MAPRRDTLSPWASVKNRLKLAGVEFYRFPAESPEGFQPFLVIHLHAIPADFLNCRDNTNERNIMIGRLPGGVPLPFILTEDGKPFMKSDGP